MRAILLMAVFTAFLFVSCFGVSVAAKLFPHPKSIALKTTEIVVGRNSKLAIPASLTDRFKAATDSFKSVIAELPPTEGSILIEVGIFSQGEKRPAVRDFITALGNQEGYVIEVSDGSIKITGADELGALHGLTTLERLLNDGKGKIKQGKVADWPDHKIRAIHMVLRRTRPDDIKRIIKDARYFHYNAVVLLLADGVRLSTMKRIALDDAWTADEFLDVVNFAQENGLEVIPELKLLTHQEKLLKKAYPNLMYNKATYDPRKEETYGVVLPMIDEVIGLIHPKAIHIGHDEVAGHKPWSKKKWLRKDEEMLPPDLFLKDVERLYAHLKKCGVETWMWGDMLIAPEEFPGMLDKHLHGTHSYSSLRNKIPKDIVICDWHYFDEQPDFPSASTFAKAGHRVLGAAWKKEKTIKNFSRYISTMSANNEGMIATTWFHVQRREWDIVSDIIKNSGEAFWNAK